MNRKALLLIAAADGVKDRVGDLLADCGIDTMPEIGTDPTEFSALCQKYAQYADLIVACGEIPILLNAISGSIETNLPIACLPLPTDPQIAEWDLATDWESICRLAAKASPREIDLGWINGNYFHRQIVLGSFSNFPRQPTLTQKVSRIWRLLTGKLPHQNLEIVADGERTTMQVHAAVVRLIRRYDACFYVPPNFPPPCRLQLSLWVAERWWQRFAAIPALLGGDLPFRRRIAVIEADEIKLLTPRTITIDIDGIDQTTTPVYLRSLQQGISVFSP
jgi:diacylglycerol kinase family enzyme